MLCVNKMLQIELVQKQSNRGCESCKDVGDFLSLIYLVH